MNINPARRLAGALLSALLLAMSPAGVTQDDAQRAVVERFQNELIEVMKAAQQLGYRGRYAKLAPAVRRSHDIATIARISVGAYWDGLNPQQRAALIETFGELSVSTYAHRFDGYDGEHFQTQSSGALGANVAGVQSMFTQAGGDRIRFDYVLHKTDRGWRIVNIVVDGVSDLALKRAEYTEILGSDGFNALIAALQEKIDANAE
ncbi:MAG: ABC transporter substrate-binding protein [Gammaproteobacteria bacterium]